MKNVEISVKQHRRIIKSSGIGLIFFFLFISLYGFRTKPNDESSIKQLSERSKSVSTHVTGLFPDSVSNAATAYAPGINSKAVPFVRKYIQVEGERLEKMKVWGKRVFEIYDHILSQYGLPKELKYLSVIESDITAKAVSNAGAVGPWQIMGEEATRMGLRISHGTDERKSFKKSTHAAAKILKELYSEFNDWTLVIAAYNCGAGRVRQAIKKSGSKNFWYLQAYLPPETRCHVKRFIGTHYFFEGSGGVTTMTASEIKRYRKQLAVLELRQFKAAEEEYCNQFSRFDYCPFEIKPL